MAKKGGGRRWLSRRRAHVVLLLAAVVLGAAGGGAEILFRLAYSQIQFLALGTPEADLVTVLADEPWWRLLLAPTLGGLAIGVFTARFLPDRRPQAVADVIHAAHDPRAPLQLGTGLKVAAVNAASIGVGASVGREGPMVHLGATLGSVVARVLSLPRTGGRVLLGCGVAAGVAASFNAPIAGVFFALEVVIGHYALSAFAPIVIASVTGTVVSRWWHGDFPAFVPPETYTIASQWEFLAFALLGVTGALVAMVLMTAIMGAGALFQRSPIPAWARPALAGLAVGLLAIAGLPHVLGVGYAATSAALAEAYGIELLLGLIAAKIAATSLCLGAGFGGGVFSPSVYVGAMTGGAFGLGMATLFPDLAATHGAYAIIGMGAVAGSVLGAPISTILIVFELTGNYELTVGVMVATVIASEMTATLYTRSLFAWQLRRRGIDLRGGEEDTVLHEIPLTDLVRHGGVTAGLDTPVPEIYARLGPSEQRVAYVLDDAGRLLGRVIFSDMTQALAAAERDGTDKAAIRARDLMKSAEPVLTKDDTLARALDVFGEATKNILPVVEDVESRRFRGVLAGYDLMQAYHRALRDVREAERN